MRMRGPLSGWRQLLLSLLLVCTGCRAAEVVIGGDRGWTLGVAYRDVYVQPGDVLVRRPYLGHT